MNLLPENTPFIHPDRVRRLNGQPWRAGRYVLYWMQQAQRARDNPALLFLEWSPTPEEAFRRCFDLNHRYFLDGLAPNSYANVGWIFGLHDRPWPERPVFGTVRYMNAARLERKCDMPAYLDKIKALQVD